MQEIHYNMSSKNENWFPRSVKFYIVSFSLLSRLAECAEYESNNWDPECTTKWPGCTLEGIHYINTACERKSCNPIYSQCVELEADAEFRRMVLDKHNELRNKVASGEETRSEIAQASDMMALSYDLGLEFTAICHVHRCVMEHDKCRGTKKFPNTGQNLALLQTAVQNPITSKQIENLMTLEHFSQLVVNWYETEIEKDTFGELIDNFTRMNHETAHFTALIWAKTTHLGCAKALNRNNLYEATIHITCHYAEQGNIIETPMYTKGKACSKCPSGTSCNKKYTSLCGYIDDSDVDAGLNPFRSIDKTNGIERSSIPKWRTFTVIVFTCVFIQWGTIIL